MSLTRELAQWALTYSADAVVVTDWSAAKRMLLDALGCALTGYCAQGCSKVLGVMKDRGRSSESLVLFSNDRLPMPYAAFANSVQLSLKFVRRPRHNEL
jgi:2-methylcitrate dehydratase PrpD